MLMKAVGDGSVRSHTGSARDDLNVGRGQILPALLLSLAAAAPLTPSQAPGVVKF